MKIVPIFASHIWSICYEGDDDIYSLLIERWTDQTYLLNFFEENKELLNNPFWEGWTLEDLMNAVYEEANELNNYFLYLHNNAATRSLPDFNSHFKPLSANSLEMELVRSKSYGKGKNGLKPSLLRIYAIKVDSNAFLLTGWAIKLTRKMTDCTELQTELNRLEWARKELKKQGIIGIDELNDEQL